jgi:hypothetical protein
MVKLVQNIEPGDFRDTQLAFAAHIRHPQKNPAPADIEDRRLAIYRDLFYNNIESFLSSGFPVLKSILDSTHWHAMVRDFIHRHQSHSPYFLQISEEFLSYLQTERLAQPDDPDFMLELAHYEWIELALDISSLEIPIDRSPAGNLVDNIPLISPTAWRFIYQYPVHKIGPNYQPAAGQAEPAALIVYRNRELQIGFMESNTITLRLLDIIESQQCSGRQAIVRLAEEIDHPAPDSLVTFGADILGQLYSREIISGFQPI